MQVRLLLERNREDLQRQLAVSEGQLGLMQEHLAEARQEIEGLRQRVSLEQGRTSGDGAGHCLLAVQLQAYGTLLWGQHYLLCCGRADWSCAPMVHMMASLHGDLGLEVRDNCWRLLAVCCTPMLLAELESLLAAQRAREYSGELGLQQGAGQLGAIQQRNKALEQQVGTLGRY